MKITVKSDFRNFKAGDVFDFSIIDKIRTITVVGENGCGKSSLFHALRGLYKGVFGYNTNRSLYETDFKLLGLNIEVEHSYEQILFLDNIKDNGTDMNVAYDASSFISNGGWASQNLSHGQCSIFHINKFITENKEKIIPNKTLFVFDEIDNGFSLGYMGKFINLIKKIAFAKDNGCHIIVISHNPFFIKQSLICYDFENKKFENSDIYIEEKTGFKIEELNKQ
jgi:predicted ATPase